MTLTLLAARAEDATVCPSEVARALAATHESTTQDIWRSEMAAVHAAVDELLAQRLICISWKGHDLPVRSGPYRIRQSD